jgi:hypothetical protein
MKTEYKEINFRADSLAKINLANEIINSYDGLKLTLRQLYYQFVTRNAIPNKENAYKGLGNLISDARLAGLLDWEAIEDRVRVPKIQNQYDDLKALIEAALYSYRLPRWEGQDWYVELWCEKDAVSNILEPMASKYHIVQMVNRGYSSQSAMHDTAERFLEQDEAKRKALLYLGDHDASGEDMVRDIRERLAMFGVTLTVDKIALTFEQVKQYNLVPNPAKLTDTRSKAYIKKFGNESWELDALPPDVLHQLIEKAILQFLDIMKMKEIITKEESDKEVLTKVVDNIIQGKGLPTCKLGRKPLNHSVKNVSDTLLSTHSIGLAAKELNCSRGYIYQVLKQAGTTPKEVMAK